MAKKRYHIVWNQRKTEGFITNDATDARAVSDGSWSGVNSTVGEAFREAYADDDNGEELPMQEVVIEV